MSTIITRKNYKILDPTPTGDAGAALNDNFTRVGDDVETLTNNKANKISGPTSGNVVTVTSGGDIADVRRRHECRRTLQ